MELTVGAKNDPWVQWCYEEICKDWKAGNFQLVKDELIGGCPEGEFKIKLHYTEKKSKLIVLLNGKILMSDLMPTVDAEKIFKILQKKYL